MFMGSLGELVARFRGVPGVSFSDATGLVSLRVRTRAAEAELFLQGAHLASWTPAGERPVLYLSPKSNYAAGKPIRGGIPVLFPWFGNGWDGTRVPTHGFARTSAWTLEAVEVDGDGAASVRLGLGPNEASRAIGFPDFGLTAEFRIGRELRIALTVENRGSEPLTFEEGLHNYFAIGDIRQVWTEGLAGAVYTDKRDNMAVKRQSEAMLRYTRDTDRVYNGAAGPLVVHDAAWGRRIRMEKQGSATTVTWNPWSTLTPTLPDLPADGWERFVCVEAVNAGSDRVTLAAGAVHRMECVFSLLGAGD